MAQRICASVSTAHGRIARRRVRAMSGTSPHSAISRNTTIPDRPQPPRQCASTRPLQDRIARALSLTAGHPSKISGDGAPKSSIGRCTHSIPVANRSCPRPPALFSAISEVVVMEITASAHHLQIGLILSALTRHGRQGERAAPHRKTKDFKLRHRVLSEEAVSCSSPARCGPKQKSFPPAVDARGGALYAAANSNPPEQT